MKIKIYFTIFLISLLSLITLGNNTTTRLHKANLTPPTVAIANNTIDSTQSICFGATPNALIGTIPTGGDGVSYTYSWLQSTTDSTSGFAIASGINNTINYAPSILTQTTWYRRLVTSSTESDTSIAIKVTIHQASSSTTTTTSCDSLWWNGTKYTATGIYKDTIPNAAGCDSIMTLDLTINYSAASTFTASACGSYTWSLNNKVYTSSNNTDTVHLTTTNGCDSLITLNLTILANITDVHINGIGAFCGDTATTQLSTNINATYGAVTYEWIRLGYNEDTWQVVSTDSVVNVTDVYPAQYVVKTVIAGCGTFYSNQQTVMPVKAPTVALNLSPTVSICNNNIVNFTASSADSGVNNYAFYNGSTLVQNSTALTYNTPTLTTANSGAIYTVEASNLKPTFDGNITENFWGKPLAISTGGPASSFGTGHELNAVYARADNDNLYVAIAGNVQNNNRIMVFIDSKSGGYNTSDYGRNGIANNGIKNFNSGCIFDPGFNADYCLGIGTDATNSQYYLDLVTLNGNAATGTSINNYIGTNLSPASGYSIGANPANSSQTNGFEVAIPKSALGYTNGDIRIFLMYSGDNGFLSNQFLTRANIGAGNYGNGIVNFALAAPNPIDIPVSSLQSTCKTLSTATTVTVKPNFTSTTTTSACDSLIWNGIKYTTTGNYTFIATGSNNCDSIATLVLTINHPTTSTLTTSSCDSLAWNGTTYYTSGTYTFNTTNATNCDSVATLVLTIDTTPAKPTITVFTASITSPQTAVVYTCSTVANAASYTWIYTGTGATIINNGTNNITVDFAANATSGDMQVIALNGASCTSAKDSVAVVVTPLPVKIISYELRITNEKQVTNLWKTATEVNSKNFEVQRSTDSKTFETIGTVAAKGFASNYSFTDPLTINHLPPTIYYRLKQVDNDGKFAYSEVRQIQINQLTYKPINLFPNPAQQFISLKVDKLIGTATVVFVDMYGKQVLKQIINNQLSIINVQQFAKGTYLVEIITNDGRREMEKFVKE